MMSYEANWPGIAHLFSQAIIPKVTETDETTGEDCITQGSLIFSVGPWIFENGALLGYGLKSQPVLLTKLLGLPAGDTERFTGDYLKTLTTELLNVAAVQSTTTLADLFLAPTLIKSGYEVKPNAKWMKTALTDQEWLWNFIQLTCREGAGVGFHFPDVFERCWRNSYQPDKPGSESYEEARRLGVLEMLQQEDRILEAEVKKTLTDALQWIQQPGSDHFTPDEVMTLGKLSERP